jgi:hypothetical protein
MRIHESSHLEISFLLGGQSKDCAMSTLSSNSLHECRTAAILENSSQITFTLIRMIDVASRDAVLHVAHQHVEDTSQTERRPFIEVKDFNWLRTGIPSPNFAIKEKNATGISGRPSKLITSEAAPPQGETVTPLVSPNSLMKALAPFTGTEGRTAADSCLDQVAAVAIETGDDDDDEL